MFEVIVFEELQDITFEEMICAFAGTRFEVDLNPNAFLRLQTPWLTLTDEQLAELEDLGFAGGIMPRGAGNGDTAFYALDLTEYYDFDTIRVALIDLA